MRTLRWTAATGLTALVLVAATLHPSFASSSSTDLAGAKAKLAALDARMAALVQQEDLARAALARARTDLTAAQQEAATAHAEAVAAKAAQAKAAADAYETTTSELAAVLGANSLSTLSDRVQYLGIVATSNANLANRALVAAQQARVAEARVSSLIATQQTLLNKLDAERRQIASEIANEQALVKKIRREMSKPYTPPVSAGGSGGGSGPGPSPSPSPTPPPGPPPPPPPPASQIDAMIYSIWGHNQSGDTAECIADRESGDNPYALNASTGAAGLFQLMPFWWDGNNAYHWKFDPYDAYQNAYHSYLIWQMDGWQPWGGGC